MRVLIHTLLISSILAVSCPLYLCTDFGKDLCAYVDEGYIQLNSQGCAPGLNCSLGDLAIWASSAKERDVFHCADFNSSSIVQHLVGRYGYHCGTRRSGRTLLSGSHPKVCDSAIDCALTDGSLSPCGCGFTVLQYCIPDWGSEVFDADKADQSSLESYKFFLEKKKQSKEALLEQQQSLLANLKNELSKDEG